MWRTVLASCQLPVFTGEFDLPGVALPLLLSAPPCHALAQGKVACLQWKHGAALGC